MNKLVICTTGTSISNRCPAQRKMFKQHNDWNDDGEELKKEIIEFLNKPENSLTKEKTRRTVCAEMNTLDRIGIKPSDRIILLASDTAQGRVCAEMIKKVVIDAYNLSDEQVEVRRIEGLQVHNAKILREYGLKNLVKVALEYLADEQVRYSYDIILNSTGGFKGIVPFLTILGMLYGRRTVYLFEFSDQLITLPPLPFSFDLQLYSRVKYALTYIDEEIAVPEQAFLSKVTNYTTSERDLFMAFTEPFEDGLVTLSPLAYCLLSIDSDEEYCLVSKQVNESLKKNKGLQSIAIKRLITNSKNPLWRSIHIHRWETTDLLIMKQAKTAERIAGFLKNEKFHVTHIFSDHLEYERTLGKFSKKDFKDTEFVRWEVSEDLGVDQSNRDILAEERDKLIIKIQELQDELDRTINQKKKIEANFTINDNKINDLESRLTINDTKIKDLGVKLNLSNDEILNLNQEVSTLQSKLKLATIERRIPLRSYFKQFLRRRK
ncbi:MAG: putative CRISPR-associated protein (TIGR02619 family) [bacterium]|jgi:putative CRISPR-associated protein (TIGR02619 family)